MIVEVKEELLAWRLRLTFLPWNRWCTISLFCCLFCLNIADVSSLWNSIVLFGDHDLGSTRFGWTFSLLQIYARLQLGFGFSRDFNTAHCCLAPVRIFMVLPLWSLQLSMTFCCSHSESTFSVPGSAIFLFSSARGLQSCYDVGMSILIPGFSLDPAGSYLFVRHFWRLFTSTFDNFGKCQRIPRFSLVCPMAEPWINAVELWVVQVHERERGKFGFPRFRRGRFRN
jgi:hypothetical protein